MSSRNPVPYACYFLFGVLGLGVRSGKSRPNGITGFLIMHILTEKLTVKDLKQIAAHMFGNMVKAVVDIDKEVIAVDAELHADLEALLLEKGSERKSLWGINLYPEMQGDEFIEFDSMINIRPSQGNRSRRVESEETRKKIAAVVSEWIAG